MKECLFNKRFKKRKEINREGVLNENKQIWGSRQQTGVVMFAQTTLGCFRLYVHSELDTLLPPIVDKKDNKMGPKGQSYQLTLSMKVLIAHIQTTYKCLKEPCVCSHPSYAFQNGVITP